jgi:hypothetical protein
VGSAPISGLLPYTERAFLALRSREPYQRQFGRRSRAHSMLRPPVTYCNCSNCGQYGKYLDCAVWFCRWKEQPYTYVQFKACAGRACVGTWPEDTLILPLCLPRLAFAFLRKTVLTLTLQRCHVSVCILYRATLQPRLLRHKPACRYIEEPLLYRLILESRALPVDARNLHLKFKPGVFRRRTAARLSNQQGVEKREGPQCLPSRYSTIELLLVTRVVNMLTVRPRIQLFWSKQIIDIRSPRLGRNCEGKPVVNNCNAPAYLHLVIRPDSMWWLHYRHSHMLVRNPPCTFIYGGRMRGRASACRSARV